MTEQPIDKNRSESTEKSYLSFQNLAEDWYESIHLNVKSSTSIKYRNMLERYVFSYLGNLPIEEINYNMIESFSKYLLTHHGNHNRGLSHKTASDILSMLRSILKYGLRKGAHISPDVFSYQIKTQHPPIRVLSYFEQEKLCQTLCENLNILNVGILLTLFTGLRIGELCALKWKDFSFDESTVHINKTMQRIQTVDDPLNKTKLIISSPKTANAIRYIPIPQNLIPLIQSLQKGPEEYFLSDKKHLFVEPRLMQRHLKNILDCCGIREASFHTLRHTFATRCVEMDFDVKSLSEILGHSNVSITMNRYVHPSMELKRKNMEKLSSLLNNIDL